MKYQIINLVREDFNKSITLFYISDENKIKSIYLKFLKYLDEHKDSDLYNNIIKVDGHPVVKLDRASIDMLVDDSWWSDSDLVPVMDEVLRN